MKKRLLSTVLKSALLAITVATAHQVFSQCTNSFAEGAPAPYNGNWQNMSIGSGTYADFNVTAGRIYSFRHSSLPASWSGNSQLTLTLPGSSVLAYNDNNGPYFNDNCNPGELNASIDYVANFSGVMRVHSNANNCQGFLGGGAANSAVLQYKETIPPALTFGVNQWNVYATVGTNINLSAAFGFYTDPSLNFNTTYTNTLSPSSLGG